MTRPILKAAGPMVSASTNTKLTVTVPAASDDDLVIIYVKGASWSGDNTGRPTAPPGWRELYGRTTIEGFDQILWARVGDSFNSTVQLVTPESPANTTWWAHADVFSNADFSDPGWLEALAAGGYATFDRSDITTPTTTFGVIVRVSFDALGAAQWMYGWASGDVGFGLNASNRPIAFIKNTLGNNIGNAAANTDVPGLVTNRKVWLSADINVVTADVTYYYCFADLGELDAVSGHWTQLGTTVAGTNAGTTPRVTNSDKIFIGRRDAGTANPANMNVYVAAETAASVNLFIQNFSDDLQAGATLVGAATQRTPTPGLGTSSPIEDWQIGDSYTYPTTFYLQARKVFGPDRLIYHVWLGTSFSKHQTHPVEGPAAARVYADRSAGPFGTFGVKNVTRTVMADADTVDLRATKTNHYNFGFFGMTIRGVATPVRPPLSPQPSNIKLGCAVGYGLYLTDMTYDRVIDRVGWSRLDWERVLDDISNASATIPDELGGVLCAARLGGLLPWAYGLRIERNDRLVWRGPIRKVERNGDDIQVQASDVLSRYRKRFLTRDPPHEHTNQDAGMVFRHIITTHATPSYDSWAPPVPEVNVNVPITRSMRPMEFKYAWDLLSELLESAVDAFVMNGIVYVWDPNAGWCYQAVIKRVLDGPYNSDYDLVYGTFTAESFASRPDWSIDGDMQGNYIAVPSADSGEFGFRTAAISEVLSSQVAFGVLDYVDPNPIELPADQAPSTSNSILRARADTLAALRAYAPAILSGGVLSPEAPVDVDNLIPGSLWKLDIYDAGFGQLITVGRLRRVSVSVSVNDTGISEEITPTLEPPGWMGELDV